MSNKIFPWCVCSYQQQKVTVNTKDTWLYIIGCFSIDTLSSFLHGKSAAGSRRQTQFALSLREKGGDNDVLPAFSFSL